MTDAPRRGPEVVRLHPGTAADRWHFWPNDDRHGSMWPTAELAFGLADGEIDDPDGYAVQAVLYAYVDLLTHPAGTESRVKILRALRRAEKGVGRG